MEKSSRREKHQQSEIGPYDILCGRRKTAFNNVGNRRFRVTISLNLPRYLGAKSRHEKSAVIISIVRMLRNDVGARFLKREGKEFIELDETQARGKVGHALRDMSVAQQQSTMRALMGDKDDPIDLKEDQEEEDSDLLDSSFDSFFEMCEEHDDDEPLEPIPVHRSPEYVQSIRVMHSKTETPSKKVHMQSVHNENEA
jgi:hypothetical protein